MFSMNPGKIVRESIDRSLKAVRSGNCAGLVVQASKENPVLVRIANLADALAHQSVTEIINQGIRQDAVVVDHDSFVVVHRGERRRFTRKERSACKVLVPHGSGYGNTMLGIAGNVVVEARYIHILGVRDRCAEIKTAIVQSVACIAAIGLRKRIQICQNHRARAKAKRVPEWFMAAI